jgi:porin
MITRPLAGNKKLNRMGNRAGFTKVKWLVVLAFVAVGLPVEAQNDQAASQEQASPNNPPGNTPGTSNGLGATAGNTGNFKQEDYLTGDWGGWRKRLFDDGFSLTPVYSGEVMGNPSGGKRQGVIYEGLFNVSVDFDLEKMSNGEVDDLTIHANALEIHGPSLSLDDTGDFSNTSSIAGYNTLRLDELWIQKGFMQQRLSVKVGNIAVDTEFFQSSSAGLFIGATFGAFTLIANNLPNPPVYPAASPGIRLKLSPTPETYLMGGVFGMDNDSNLSTNNQSGTRFALNGHSGMLIMAEAGYLLNQGPHDKGLQGSYRLGSIIDTGNFDTFASQAAAVNGTGPLRGAGSDYAIYAVVDQQVYVHDQEAISLFARIGGAPADTNFVHLYWDCGFNLAGWIPGRPDDIGGLAVARSEVSSSFSDAQVSEGNRPYTAETFLESTYRVQLQPWWSVQPVAQYILTPSGQQGSKNALVLGLRSSIAF